MMLDAKHCKNFVTVDGVTANVKLIITEDASASVNEKFTGSEQITDGYKLGALNQGSANTGSRPKFGSRHLPVWVAKI